jgi:hypothetical protein
MYTATWCTYCKLLFDIVSTIVEALVMALHQFLYPFITEWCRLRCKACGHSFFRKLSLSDTISWRSDGEIRGKCRESDAMVKCLFALIFSSNARTKSSFTTDGGPLHRSSCTFSRPSLSSYTHLRTTELLIACSPYTSQSWRISAGFMFFAFKKRLTDRISYAAGFSTFLNIIYTQHDV